jgi:hypothetical protein
VSSSTPHPFLFTRRRGAHAPSTGRDRSPTPHSLLLPGARKRHCGPQDGGDPSGSKKKQRTKKKSAQRRELLFSGAADSTGLTSQPCLPTESSKDTRTAAEKAELLAWVQLAPSSPSPPCSNRATRAHLPPLTG